ncbi:MAG: hypothetical protein Q9162_001611 [Coniocarpon cinnabarinum]
MADHLSLAIFITFGLLVLPTLSLGQAQPQPPLPLSTIYQFPQNLVGHSWLGNVATRPSGHLLITTIDSPDVYQLDPNAPEPTPQVVSRFPNANGTVCITETRPDSFAVITGDVGRTSQEFAPNSGGLWNLTFSGRDAAPSASFVASLSPEIRLINGVAALPSNPTTVLGSDSFTGAIWALDTVSGNQVLVSSSESLSPSPPVNATDSSKLGVNGLKVVKVEGCTWLYFSNTAKGILARMEIEEMTGVPAGKPEVLTRAPGAQLGVGFDDFALQTADDGTVLQAWLADSRGNSVSVWKAGHDGEPAQIVDGNAKTSEIAEPEAAAFGRTAKDKEVLYVVSTGGEGNRLAGERVGGQVLAIDTSGFGE